MTRRIFTTSHIRTLIAGLSLLATFLLQVSPAIAATPATLKTKLSGAVIGTLQPEGSAVYHTNQNVAVFTAEVEQVSLEAGTVLSVSVQSVDGTTTVGGQITLDATGVGEVELNSRAGDTVPAIQKGDIVIVSTSDGTAIMSGTF